MSSVNDSKLIASKASNEPQTLEEYRDLFAVVSVGKQTWENTFDAIVDPVLIVKQDYSIERANLAAADSVQGDIRQLVGKKCYEVFAKRSSPCNFCPMVAKENNARSKRRRLEPFQDGRDYAASAFAISTKDGKDSGLSVVQYQDISDIRKLESQLIQNEKMLALGHFAGGIAHDINNPLSGVLAFAQLALQGMDPNSQSYQDVKEIEVSADRCKKIVEGLVEFAKPLQEFQRSSLDLGELIKSLLPTLEVQWTDKNYDLSIKLQPLSKVEISEAKMGQVFTNLLSNAYQAIGEGGAMSISGGEVADFVYIDIADDGEGIAPEHQEHIFDPYFSTKTKKGGTGLGLSTTYNIVREHGGRIKVTSDLGRGTLFRVYVPKHIA